MLKFQKFRLICLESTASPLSPLREILDCCMYNVEPDNSLWRNTIDECLTACRTAQHTSSIVYNIGGPDSLPLNALDGSRGNICCKGPRFTCLDLGHRSWCSQGLIAFHCGSSLLITQLRWSSVNNNVAPNLHRAFPYKISNSHLIRDLQHN
jgi:hypothetical protein